jgi:peptidyl-prolyl cis-trans isomerase B (cyclophilin B)
MFRHVLAIASFALAFCAPASALAANPQVELDTSAGKIRLELFPNAAPKTVANFLEYVKLGHYKGTVFHRVIDGFMIQGGGFTAEYWQKPTKPPVENEAQAASKAGLQNTPGTIAMARTNDPHSATAQFFINVADNDFLDHKGPSPQGWGYCVFGKVTGGTDVVDRIKGVKTGRSGFHQDVPLEDVVIERAEVIG